VSAERLALGAILLDVSLVSVGILALGHGTGEVSGPNQRNLFACYLVVQAATGLRYDPRLCLYATALALLPYAAVATLGMQGAALPTPGAGPEATAALSLHAHAVRFTLLGVTATTSSTSTTASAIPSVTPPFGRWRRSCVVPSGGRRGGPTGGGRGVRRAAARDRPRGRRLPDRGLSAGGGGHAAAGPGAPGGGRPAPPL